MYYKARNNTRKILTTVLLIALTICIFLAFSGVQPLSTWKDNVQTYISGFFNKTDTSTHNVAVVKDIYASYVLSRAISVLVVPTSYAVANHNYAVELYENGTYRATTYVVWNQPELNVKKEKYVNFPITREEFSAYHMENIKGMFSVKIY
jgi:ABC-type phosphate/phosphonate transport system permease subunit